LAADKLLSADKRPFTPQILVVSPTREIAQQNYTVLKAICPNRFTVG
jgi:superfamily II DNA/RNA helicase